MLRRFIKEANLAAKLCRIPAHDLDVLTFRNIGDTCSSMYRVANCRNKAPPTGECVSEAGFLRHTEIAIPPIPKLKVLGTRNT